MAAPDSPLNVDIGPHRRFAWVRADLAESSGSRTRSAAPSTTSCSTAVAGALGSYLRARGHDTDGLELHAMVPVSVRAAERARARSATRSRAMMAPLPVWCEDPVERLRDRQRGDGRPEGVQAGGRRRAC